ncbi:MAG: trypsin-like serine protease [Gemmatimonadetes bacterium]|nr:trypsin-like serine protease [Gemmatimonadota bacterium]
MRHDAAEGALSAAQAPAHRLRAERVPGGLEEAGQGALIRVRTAFSFHLALVAALPVAACGRARDQAAAPSESFTVTQGLEQAQERRQQASGTVDASRRTAIVEAASRAAPAVVTVNTIETQRVQQTDFFGSFFLPPNASRQATGLGSGFVISADGVILTNDHVVRGADRIKVTLSDGRDLDAELVGTDPVTDVAVLRVAAKDLPVAPLGTSQGLLIGEWVVAIGNPFGNMFSNSEPTVTTGVVSAVGRHIIPNGEEQGFYLGMIQTDASINPGNSGGPLVNVLGEVIGINSSIFSRSGGSEGLGFAIPIDRALRVAEDLLKYHEVRRAWLGFDVEPVEADDFGRTRGVRIGRVVAGSPGAAAKLAPGTRLLEAAGRRLAAPLDFENVLMDLRAGDQIEIVAEGGRKVRLRSEALPSVRAERVRILEDLELISVTPDVKAERGVQSDQGALVVGISAELQSQLGFRPGDVLLQVNNARVASAEDAARIFKSIRSQGTIQIYFERDGGLRVQSFNWRG